MVKELHNIHDEFSISHIKSVNEEAVVEQFLNVLGIGDAKIEQPMPIDPPDVILVHDNRRIGIEVVGLIDETVRRLNAQARSKEIKLNSTFSDASTCYADWTALTLRSKLCELLQVKEKKIEQGRKSKTAVTGCDEFWLLVHADELMLVSQTVGDFLIDWQMGSAIFTRAYLVLSYEPGLPKGKYPMFSLMDAN